MSDDEPPPPPPRPIPGVIWAVLGLVIVVLFILVMKVMGPAGP